MIRKNRMRRPRDLLAFVSVAGATFKQSGFNLRDNRDKGRAFPRRFPATAPSSPLYRHAVCPRICSPAVRQMSVFDIFEILSFVSAIFHFLKFHNRCFRFHSSKQLKKYIYPSFRNYLPTRVLCRYVVL